MESAEDEERELFRTEEIEVLVALEEGEIAEEGAEAERLLEGSDCRELLATDEESEGRLDMEWLLEAGVLQALLLTEDAGGGGLELMRAELLSDADEERLFPAEAIEEALLPVLEGGCEAVHSVISLLSRSVMECMSPQP